VTENISPPNMARIYDWLLGGTDNEPADRVVGERLESLVPLARSYAQTNRDFVRRVVRYALGAGIRQFIDVGAGLPTKDAVPGLAEDSRVVLVDNDPVAVEVAERMLGRDGDPARHRAILGDVLTPGALWKTVDATGLIDRDQPTCLLMTAFLHFIKDETGLAGHLAEHRAQLAPGSLFALSHSTEQDAEDSPIFDQAVQFHANDDPGRLRGQAEVAALLGDFVLLAPGVVFAGRWRPDAVTNDPFAARPALSHTLVAVARKP
jgi:O-methyltransferase involved in polyketide biosynthesis